MAEELPRDDCTLHRGTWFVCLNKYPAIKHSNSIHFKIFGNLDISQAANVSEMFNNFLNTEVDQNITLVHETKDINDIKNIIISPWLSFGFDDTEYLDLSKACTYHLFFVDAKIFDTVKYEIVKYITKQNKNYRIYLV